MAVKMPLDRRALAVFIAVLVAAGTLMWTRSSATVPLAPVVVLKVDTSHPGSAFDLGAVGLSTETSELSTGRLSAYDYNLVRLMRLLGPSVLRIGGSSVDFSWWTSSGEAPASWATSTVTPADLSILHGLLTATGWRVLLGVDFGHFEPAHVAEEARFAKEILGKSLLGIEIGNEPNSYKSKSENLRPPAYSVGEYLHEAEAYRQALGESASNVAIVGPALAGTDWLSQIGPAADMFTEITQHFYPTSLCPAMSSTSVAPPTAAELLSPAVRRKEEETLSILARVGTAADRPTRIGETGSSACHGESSAAPVFASALWALDWTLRAASSGVQGINFHSRFAICGVDRQNPICNPSGAGGNVQAQPEYYGMLAARQLEGGRFVPTHLITRSLLPNITTWATVTSGGTVRVAIDNVALGGLAQPVLISTSGYAAMVKPLIAPSSEARSGVTFGRIPVSGDGQWRPRSTYLSHQRTLRVIVPPASAAIVTLSPIQSSGRRSRV